jgi:FkbM family methyltransferase
MIYSKIVIKILNFLDYFQQNKIIKLINKKFSKPIIVFDIGAHHGETVKLFNKKLNIKKIYSFEASPKNFEILMNQVQEKKFNNVEIFNYGIGADISDSYINQNIESSSSTINKLNLSSKYLLKKLKVLNIKNLNSFQYQIPIKVISLDYFIEKNSIKNIDLLKIDTEGFELNVIKGLAKYSKITKLIYFEHHYDDMILKNYKFKDIDGLLKSYGFIKIKKSKMLFRKSFEYIYENIRSGI